MKLLASLVAAAALCGIPLQSWADDPPDPRHFVGEAKEGVHVLFYGDNDVTISFDETVILSNGRRLHFDGKRLSRIQPEEIPAPDVISPLDWVVSSRNYVGRRILVQNVKISGADAKSAIINLPGASARVSLENASSETLRYALTHCLHILGGEKDCIADVVGIAGRRDADSLTLSDAVVSFKALSSSPSSSAPAAKSPSSSP